MEIFQHGCSVGICGQVCFYQIAFTVNFRAISGYNVRPGIDVIDSSLLPAVLITERDTLRCYIRSGQHFPFFVNRQFAELFLIRYSDRGCLVRHQIYIIRRGIQAVSGWSRNLLQIYSILCLDNLCHRRTVFIRCRHLCDQLCTVLVTVDTKHCSSQPCIRVVGIHLDYLHLCQLQPFYRKTYIFFIFHAFTKDQSQILCPASCGDLIGRIIFCNAPLRLY